ncbi:MAG: NAD-dependent epimerase [Bacteroidales bacterium]|nr:NAD-dependent epimerase [Bacteroidales bacterium]
MKILVTGAAGFIGFHMVKRLMAENMNIVGLDSINDYYDVGIKFGRLGVTGIDKEGIEYGKMVVSATYPHYSFIKLDITDKKGLETLFHEEKFDAVCHLAAQAGVRYSLTHPGVYISSNVEGFMNILECCRHHGTGHLTYASSSSVYGLNRKMPLSASDNVDHPVSLYAATKKANELMAHTYSHLYNIPTTGLRFFTVYGPWGRPDMALFRFTEAILNNRPLEVYNHGNMVRDFTFIDDIVEGVFRVLVHPATPNPEWSGLSPDPASSPFPFRIYNIGNSTPVRLMDYIRAIEKNLGKKAEISLLPMQPGDVEKTHADVSGLMRDFAYRPSTDIETGIGIFVRWYKSFFGYS